MKQIILLLTLIIASFCTAHASVVADTTANASSKECEIDEIYERQELPRGTKVEDNYGTIREARYLLSKVTMDEGNYEVVITRKETNLYRIERTDYFIRTKYCYEYSYNEKVVLHINSRFNYSAGKILFLD